VLSPATRTKLATLEKGQLMVRHPHFTQPIFVRFPRPAVLRGRDGAERYPQAADVALEVAVHRALRALDPSISLNWVKDAIALHEDDVVLEVMRATQRERPGNVKEFFVRRFRNVIPAQTTSRSAPPATIQGPPGDDPYGF
jgi:uncharacterized protein